MKKIYLVFTLLLLVLASCSDWKYSKGTKWKQPEHYTLAKAPEQVKEPVAAQADEPAGVTETPVPNKTALPEETLSKAEATETTTSLSVDLDEVTVLDHEEDTLQSVDAETLEMAFDAERHGRRSRNMGIIGLVLTLTYIFAFVGLILSIIGLINGVKSLKARYNTPEGVRMARTGVITSSIVLGLYVLSVIVLILILLAFL